MKGDYPHFKALYAHEELAEHLLLTPHERLLISQLRGDVNRHGAAVLLKSLSYLKALADKLFRLALIVYLSPSHGKHVEEQLLYRLRRQSHGFHVNGDFLQPF